MSQVIIDTLWVSLAAFLVFWMNLGFASVESGMARSKNAVNILSKNFIVFAVSSLGFMLLGFGLMFGGGNPFIGTQNIWILSGIPEYYTNSDTLLLGSPIAFWIKFFWLLVFCGTAATIVSGAVAERVKYVAFIVFSFALTLIIYPVIGHWIWGGGWLANLGFQDFAGGTVVHSLGGWAALAGAIILGPRIGKYGKDGKPRAIPGHNMSLAVIGVFVLWLGWFGFNPGSTLSFANPGDVAHVLLTTNTAAIAGILLSTITSWLKIGKPDLGMTINGCLAGLVIITPGAAYVSIPVSLLLGAIGGIVVVFAVLAFDKAKVDDPVGATSVHLVCGILGSLAIGLFAEEGITTLSPANGLFYDGGFGLLGIQALGVFAVAVFGFATSALVWFVLKKTIGIRVTAQEEIEGLDIGEHGNKAYPDFAAAVNLLTDGDEVIAVSPPKPVIPAAQAIPIVNTADPGAKITKVSIITGYDRMSKLQESLDAIGITGMTITSVMGYGMQKGHPKEYYRGTPVETKLLPKVQLDIVICKVPVPTLVDVVKRALYTGNIGDGKLFINNVENVIKVRTGEEGYDALQDEV
ncbi:MAG: ammonium transporter [Oscillospiraceae bacterium]|jgi:Amt family ammonium transporter|nr:ammonium transporter [Oscillospiraceae bacterium]